MYKYIIFSELCPNVHNPRSEWIGLGPERGEAYGEGVGYLGEGDMGH